MTESEDAGDGNEEDAELIVGDDGGTPEKGATAATATEEGKSNGTERPSEEPLSEVDALLRADEEDKALLDRLAEYDPGNGYDKVYHIGPSAPPPPLPSATVAVDAAASAKGGPDAVAAAERRVVVKVTVPIASTIDDHEVNDEGEFLAAATTASNKDAPPMQRLPFSLHGSSAPMARTLLPKERAAEWKRWTKAICDRIPDQVTFEELGVGVVFEPEGRLMNNKRKGQGGDGEGGERHAEDAAAYNRGKGKVLRKNAGAEDADDDAAGGDAAMGEADDETKAMAEDAKGVGGSNKKAEEKENQGSTTKTFSVTPVPSFYNQDLQRIRNIQSEMVRSLQVQQSRERVIRAQVEYDAAYKRSINVQQAKAAALQEYAALPEKFKEEEAAILNERNVHLAVAKRHWEMRQYRLKVMGQTFGEEQALNISVCNDVLQDLKDRVCIRVSEELTVSGLGTHRLYLEASKARSKGDESRDVSATVLGHMIDSVYRRHQDILQDNAEFVTPVLPSPDNVIAALETGETMAQRRARTEREMRAKIAQFDMEFKDAERKRSETWLKLRKARGDGGSSGVQSASTGGGIANKAKPRSRKSVPAPAGGGGGAVAPSGQPYPMQMQTQPGPGYVPASYYQPQRPPAAATQMQAQMVAPAAAQMMMQQAQISRMQTMMVQQQQQQYQTHALFPVQSHPVQNTAVSQMIASQMPQPGGIVSAVPSLISVTADPSFVSSASSIFASTIANETVIVQDTAPPPLDVQKQHTSEAKQSKYGYGDRYSQTNVNARKNADGTVVPASTPKLLPDGTYARPAGRQRKGMDWDAIKGCWYPVPGGGGSSYSGSGNEEG
jgi:hypothetical protein